MQARLISLSRIFCIDPLGFGLMDNHLHVVLRTRPDLVEGLSNEEVAIRWLALFPPRANGARLAGEALRIYIEALANNPKRIRILRERLGSLSWFMKSVNEFIARRANREDGCKGRFWEGRFKCQQLHDEASILSCLVYVDLNPIRAGICGTPEESEFTSAYERIQAVKSGDTDGATSWLTPIQTAGGRRGFLSISTLDYLSILDATGREIKKGKRGRISPDLAPILERIGIKAERWIDTANSCSKHFGHSIGSPSALHAVAIRMGKRWLKGSKAASNMFV
ncbi:MAG: hypothetical protein K1X83_14560 [Oligoflexia bacterium]|nr:hypothetical protein [Oligoflexia bacterium]